MQEQTKEGIEQRRLTNCPPQIRKMKPLRHRRRNAARLLCLALFIITTAVIAGAWRSSRGTAPEVQTDIDPAEEFTGCGCSLTSVYNYPFNTMSQDWDAEDLIGFRCHEISAEATAAGGYFPPIAQMYTYIVCRQYGVDYETVFALIEHESKCKYDAVGDSGNSIGYMQIQEKWHKERMERLGVTDLKNPFQNILVGVDILAELQETIARSGTDMLEADVLAAYQYGMQGARRHLWANGVHLYEYNMAILQRAEELRQDEPERR